MIAGGAAAIAGVRLGADFAIPAGMLAYRFEPMVENALAELRPDTRRRAAQMLEAAAQEAGCDPEQLEQMTGKTEQTRLMTGLAIVAAERTTWPPQVIALGRVLAAGLIADGDAVDVSKYALDAMSQMGRLHVSLLDLLVRYEPDWDAHGYRAVPHRAPSYHPQRLAAPPDAPVFWSVGRRVWPTELIPVVRSELAPVLTGLGGTLIRNGLAEQADKTREAIEQIGKEFQDRINRQVAGVTRAGGIAPASALQPPKVRAIERNWVPTEMGERVLGFYLEAGAGADAVEQASSDSPSM
jgi:hypothetical protein